MKKRSVLVLLVAASILITSSVQAGMIGGRFAVPASGIVGSAATLAGPQGQIMTVAAGQPTPLPADGSVAVNSSVYRLEPGIIAAMSRICEGDVDGDHDVDGSDLAAYALAGDVSGVREVAANFGARCR